MSFPKPTREPTAEPALSPTLVLPEAIVVDGTSWLRFDSASLPPESRALDDAWTSRGRFLAYANSENGFPLLQSADGESWSPLGTAPGHILYEDERGFLAGADGLWFSSDGVNWAKRGGEPTMPPDCPAGQAASVAMYGAYAAATGIVVVGDLRCGDRPVDRAAWISTDYEEWQRTEATPMFDVVRSNDVLVGIDTHGRIRSSRDGLAWSRPKDTLLNVQVLGVASGFLQVEGSSPGADPDVVLTSADGQIWVERPSPFGGSVRGLAASDGTRAIVFENGPYESGPGAVWISSTDGATWVRHQLPTREADRAGSVAILDSRVVVVGTSNDGPTVLWTAEIP